MPIIPLSVVPVVVRRCMKDTTICGAEGEVHFIPRGASVFLMIKVSYADYRFTDSKPRTDGRYRVEVPINGSMTCSLIASGAGLIPVCSRFIAGHDDPIVTRSSQLSSCLMH